MTTLREAAEMALEALTAHSDLHGTMYLKMDAITALRAALAEQPALPDAEIERIIKSHPRGLVVVPSEEVEALRRLIADDAYAMTFQSMGQYRTALLKAFNPRTGG